MTLAEAVPVMTFFFVQAMNARFPQSLLYQMLEMRTRKGGGVK